MKKICLLAIGSFFSALAFSQNAVQTVPGQPKPGRSNTTQAAATTATPTTTIVASAGDVGKTKTKAIARTSTTRTAAVKRTTPAIRTAPKAEY